MGWLRRLLGAVPKEEMDGIRMDTTRPYWEVDGPTTFTELFCALQHLLPQNAVLYFEGGLLDAEILDFMATSAIPEQTHVAMGTIWPRPRVFHVPATASTLTTLAAIMEHHAEPELAVHFHVYQADTVLLEWHDAFAQPMLISGSIPEEQVRAFAEMIGKTYNKIVEQTS